MYISKRETNTRLENIYFFIWMICLFRASLFIFGLPFLRTFNFKIFFDSRDFYNLKKKKKKK